MKLVVGNLSPLVSDVQLRELTDPFGPIVSAAIATDRGTSKGYGFVEFDSSADGLAAVAALHGHRLEGRPLVILESVDGTTLLERF